MTRQTPISQRRGGTLFTVGMLMATTEEEEEEAVIILFSLTGGWAGTLADLERDQASLASSHYSRVLLLAGRKDGHCVSQLHFVLHAWLRGGHTHRQTEGRARHDTLTQGLLLDALGKTVVV